MNMKNFLALAAAMFAVTFSSCSNDLIEKAPVTTNIETKSSIEGAYNSTFINDGIPDYISKPLEYVYGLDFYRAEIRFNNYEIPFGGLPAIHGYYASENEDMREGNNEFEKFGLTCVENYVNQFTWALELRNIPESGILIVHTASRHNDGNVYDRYIKISFD